MTSHARKQSDHEWQTRWLPHNGARPRLSLIVQSAIVLPVLSSQDRPAFRVLRIQLQDLALRVEVLDEWDKKMAKEARGAHALVCGALGECVASRICSVAESSSISGLTVDTVQVEAVVPIKQAQGRG